jgi:hypothetical protein
MRHQLTAKDMYLAQDSGNDGRVRFDGIPVCPGQVKGVFQSIHLETAVSPSGKGNNVDLRDDTQ